MGRKFKDCRKKHQYKHNLKHCLYLTSTILTVGYHEYATSMIHDIICYQEIYVTE